jgi:hypothetical protein
MLIARIAAVEVGLNLLWALLALSGVCLWAWHANRHPHRHCGALRGAVLLTCILLLLFPAISISDDLQGSDSMEDPVAAGNKLRVHGPKLYPDSAVTLPASAFVLHAPAVLAESISVSPSLPPASIASRRFPVATGGYVVLSAASVPFQSLIDRARPGAGAVRLPLLAMSGIHGESRI